jgi:hypothetical protein
MVLSETGLAVPAVDEGEPAHNMKPTTCPAQPAIQQLFFPSLRRSLCRFRSPYSTLHCLPGLSIQAADGDWSPDGR